MNGDQPISWLMFFTLAAGVVIVGGAFIRFIQSRNNREIAANTLEGDGRSRGAAPSGALPELLGITAFALIAMGLLVTGERNKSGADMVAANPSSARSDTTTGMAQPVGTQNNPKLYQPSNPATDTRTAPTASDAGVGSSPGNTGTLTK
jgi:hypothetical protein